MMWLNREFRMLDAAQLQRVHELTLEVLHRKGVVFHSDLALEIFREHGADVDGNCVTIPPAMVDAALKQCPSGFLWEARNAERSIYVGEGQKDCFYVMQDHGPVFVQDGFGAYRSGTLDDVINFYKLGQTSGVNAIVGQVTVDPHELDSKPNKHRIIFRELLKHTDKPILAWPLESIKMNGELFRMVEMVMGQDYLKEHYFLTASVCALSPLSYAQDSAETIIAYAQARQPVTLLTAPMLGVSTPIDELEALICQNAEILAGLVLAQLVQPGVPVVYGTGTRAVDMRSGNYVTGAPQCNLVDRVGLQLAHELYHLPTRTMAGNTDAKVPDIQAGYETMQNYIQLIMGGTHMINECLGILDGMLAVSYAKYIIDEEVLRRVQRMMQGVSLDEDAFDISAIMETPHGESFLMHPKTLEKCRDLWQPDVANWSNYDTWFGSGCPDIISRAEEVCRERLAIAPDSLLSRELDSELESFVQA